MKKSASIVLKTMLIISMTMCVSSQGKLCKDLNAKVLTLYQQGDYSEAAKVANKALKS